MLYDPRAWLAVILAVTALILSRSLRNEFVFDDESLILNNRYIGDWSFLWKSVVNDAWWFSDPHHLPAGAYYRPILDIWLGLAFHLFGYHAAGWHAAMIVLHLIVVWLVYRIAFTLTANPWTGIIAAALFALMPVHAEVAIWPAAIAYPLSAAFQLSAFEFYLRGGADPDRDSRRLLALSSGFYAAALMTYEGAIVFPLLIAAHAVLVRSASARRTIRIAFPYVLEAAVYVAIRYCVLGFISRPNPYNQATPSEAILTIPSAIVTYAMLLLIPWRAGPAHALEMVQSVVSQRFYLPIVELFAIFGAGIMLLRHHQHRRLYLFCAAWILIAILPVLNLTLTIIQDRYLYFASVGLCVMAADVAVTFASGDAIRKVIFGAGLAAVSVLFAVTLFSMQGYWHDDLTLFTRCVEMDPNSGFWRSQLGLTYTVQGDYQNARLELERAHQLAPADGKTIYDLGRVYERIGDRATAAKLIAQGISQFKDPPPSAYAYLAMVADAAGESKTSESALMQAAALPDGAATAALTRAQLQFIHGDHKGAEEKFRQLEVSNPDDVDALTALGAAMSADRQFDEALSAYQRAAQIAPNDANLRYQCCDLLHRLGRDREARAECTIALQIVPDNAAAQALMAEVERSAGSP